MVDTISNSLEKLKTNIKNTSNTYKFNKSTLPYSSNLKSIVAKQLHTALTQYYIHNPTNDGRNISAEFRAFEASFRMNGADGQPPPVDGADAYELVDNIRKNFSLGYRIPFNDAANIEPVLYGNVQCYWITYSHMKAWMNSPFIVYYHGGCFMFGSIYSHCGVAAHISKSFDLPLLYVEYRLAPPHSFPAQREDALSVHKALLEEDSTCADRMITYGESAGGALSIFHVQNAIENKLPVPRACVAVSPWADVTCDSESYTKNEKTEIMMSRDQGMWYISQCLGGKQKQEENNIDLRSPLYSACNGIFTGFCPLYLIAGASELLASDSELVYNAAKNCNVEVEYVSQEYMCHNWVNFGLLFPEAEIGMSKIVEWTRKKLTL